MLKVNILVTLFCGLLVFTSAQHNQNTIPSTFIDALTQGLLGEGLILAVKKFNLQGPLSEVLRSVPEVLGKSGNSDVRVKLIEPHLLSISFLKSPSGKGADVLIPLEYSIEVKFPGMPALKSTVRTTMSVRVYLKKDLNGKYQIGFENCRLLPESVKIHSDALFPIVTPSHARVENIVRNLITQNLGDKLCPVITSWLNNLTPRVAGEMKNILLLFDNFQVSE